MIPLRKPQQVLNLKRMGSYHQTRISFMRSLLRIAKNENWKYKQTQMILNEKGVGHAVYQISTPNGIFSLIAYAHDIPDTMRSDRVIATAWDATFALLNGKANNSDITRLAKHVPYQEEARLSRKELCLSRANRSVRLWEHAVEALASGQQPQEQKINEVGYLMRTTAVYGNAKFGTATRFANGHDSAMLTPFRLELLCVWLIRCFSIDWLEEIAKIKGGKNACKLNYNLKRKLGIGNSTGLGMAPFVINHPLLTHKWVQAREQALAETRSQNNIQQSNINKLNHYCNLALKSACQLRSQHELQMQKNKNLVHDLKNLQEYLKHHNWKQKQAYNALYTWAENNLSYEGQEMLVSLLIEVSECDIEALCLSMHADENNTFIIDGSLSVGSLVKILKNRFDWVNEIDFTHKHSLARFWYVSEEKLEPRLGERYEEDGSERELPLGVAYSVMLLSKSLTDFDESATLAEFLRSHPEHRHSVRRVLLSKDYCYSEVCDNILSSSLLAIDLLRFKLSFFGAADFDPRSDRWVRISMFRNAPFPFDIDSLSADSFDDWIYGYA